MVLIPLLFCLYVNDLQSELGNGPMLHLLYADDLQVYFQSSPELFNDGLTSLTEASARSLTKLIVTFPLLIPKIPGLSIIFGSSHTVRLFDSLDYPGIEFGSKTKSLGVTLDSTFMKVTNRSGGKESQFCPSGLRFIKSCTTQALRTRLVQSLFTRIWTTAAWYTKTPHVHGTPFLQEFGIFHPTRSLGGRLEGIS